MANQFENGISAGMIPDSLKTPAWWKLQNDISVAAAKGNDAKQVKLLRTQRTMERELMAKAKK